MPATPIVSRAAAAVPSRIWGTQIRARLPAAGRRVSDAPARQPRTDHQPTVPAAPPSPSADALRPTTRREAVPRQGSVRVQAIR